MKTLFATMLITLVLNTPAAKPPPLLDRLKDDHARGQKQWIYNDFQKAVTEAKRTGKPIFVTFRCVPCEACESFDAEVAKNNQRIKQLADKHFVSLRQVEMKGVDLSQFQFDYDLSWAAMFINADGTVYGRYGTQSAAGPDAYNSVESLEKTMRRVLTVHAKYATYRKYLADKRGKPKPYKTAMEMPGLDQKRKDKYQLLTERKNCIHCHNIHDAEHNNLKLTGRWSNEALWRYPLPDNIGLQIDPKDGLKINKVIPGSAAAKAGLKPGQQISYINNQLILSIADIQWVLHNLPNTATNISVFASGSDRFLNLTTQPGWKKTDVSWRGSMGSVSPFLGVWAPTATPQELSELNLANGQNALKVKWINRGTQGGREVFKAGLREGDFILALNNKPFDNTITPQRFTTHIKLNYKSGQKLPITIMRNGKRMPFEWLLP